MKNKTFSIIRKLSKKELDSFDFVIKNHKRKSLFKLYKILLESKKEAHLNTPYIYEQLYQKSYQKEKGYLLRNELRLLSKELATFLAHEQLKKETAEQALLEQYYFVKALLAREAYDLFEIEWKKLMERLLKTNNYDLAYQLKELIIRHEIKQKTITVDTYKKILNSIITQQNYLRSHFLHQLITTEYLRAFTERTIKAYYPTKQISDLNSDLNKWEELQEKDFFVKYMKLKIKSFELKGEKKIATLQKAIDIVTHVKKETLVPTTEKAWLLANIALAYLLLGKHEAALPFHEQALALHKHIKQESLGAYSFNYISTLLHLEQYSKVLKVLDEQKQVLLQKSRFVPKCLCLKAMCHLFLGELAAAEAQVPLQIKKEPSDEYYYMRYIVVIIYYLRSEVMLAINENNNYLNAINYQQADRLDTYKKLALFTNRFFKLLIDKPTITKYIHKMQKLQEELSHFIQLEQSPILPLKWLSKEIEKQSKRK